MRERGPRVRVVACRVCKAVSQGDCWRVTHVLKEHRTLKLGRRPYPNQRPDPTPRTQKCEEGMRFARPFDPGAPETSPTPTPEPSEATKHPKSRAISHYLARPLIDLRLRPHPNHLTFGRQRPSHPPTNHFYRLASVCTRFDPKKEKASVSA